jgi:hypothetical protein
MPQTVSSGEWAGTRGTMLPLLDFDVLPDGTIMEGGWRELELTKKSHGLVRMFAEIEAFVAKNPAQTQDLPSERISSWRTGPKQGSNERGHAPLDTVALAEQTARSKSQPERDEFPASWGQQGEMPPGHPAQRRLAPRPGPSQRQESPQSGLAGEGSSEKSDLPNPNEMPVQESADRERHKGSLQEKLREVVTIRHGDGDTEESVAAGPGDVSQVDDLDEQLREALMDSEQLGTVLTWVVEPTSDDEDFKTFHVLGMGNFIVEADPVSGTVVASELDTGISAQVSRVSAERRQDALHRRVDVRQAAIALFLEVVSSFWGMIAVSTFGILAFIFGFVRIFRTLVSERKRESILGR